MTDPQKTEPHRRSDPSHDPSGQTGENYRRLIDAAGEDHLPHSQHPTGDPDLTGGYFRDMTLPIAPGGTQPTQDNSIPMESDSNTRPAPVRSAGGVPVVDPEGTRVGAATSRPTPRYTQPGSAGKGPAAPSSGNKKVGGENTSSTLGCFIKGIITVLFLSAAGILAVVSLLVIQYYRLASSLPAIGDLREKAAHFETTRLMDRNGGLLYEIIDPKAGRRTYVPIGKISPYVLAATIATEDKEYYNHPGYDPIAIMRALLQNYTSGEIVSGASTITQQLAKTLLLSPEERGQVTVQRKSREIVLAAEITRRYTKEEILELYLNEINYGNLAYGIEAAAETYFHTTSDKLTLAQASFLAGLPQAPAVHDIFTNREETLGRHRDVLNLMYEYSETKGCIEVSNNIQPVCVDAAMLDAAGKEIEQTNFQLPKIEMRYPHYVNYVRSVLEQMYDPQTIYRSGFTVTTTLDPGLQNVAEEIVARQVAALAANNVTNGALVALRPGSGEILAMVGSADFYNEDIDGQVNMAISPRQPGSSIKPLTYVAAFEKGWTPATLIWDVPSEFPPSGDPNDMRPPYKPVNYDGNFHGPVTVRSALANSYNIPAVKALQFVGIYDDPAKPGEDGLINFAKRLGITTLTRPDYGMALTLGGGDVTLLELAGAYAVLANSGRQVHPVAITKIVDNQGNVVYDYKAEQGDQLIRPEHAFLISSILSDNEARSPMFGENSVLNLPFQAAVKTGTTNEFIDNWTLGYTPDLAVGVWVGNADYQPMDRTTGLSGAAPIWSEFMMKSIDTLTGGEPMMFARPPGIVERVICSTSGTEPSEWCPSTRKEVFVQDQLPLSKENDLWQEIRIDAWTGLRSSKACSEFTEDKFALNVSDSTAITWIEETEAGRNWAESHGFSQPFFFVPERQCKDTDPQPKIQFVGVSEGETILANPIEIHAIVTASGNFGEFELQYGEGESPSRWVTLVDGIDVQFEQAGQIYTWFINKIKPGSVTLRINLYSTEGTKVEKRIHLNLFAPTLTPTLTSTPEPTPTETPMPPTPTDTPEPTQTLTPTPE